MLPLRVLVCDRHDAVRTGLTALLNRDVGIELVGQVTTVPEALQAVRDQKPDLVLMDLGVPGAAGLGAIRQLRALRPGLRVVVMSISNDAESEAAARAAGAVGFLDKARIGVDLGAELRRLAGHDLRPSHKV